MIRRKVLLLAVLTAFVALWVPQRSVAAGDPIELDAILSLTGPGAFLGSAEQSGLLQAAEEVNKAGGIAGRQVKFNIQDDGSNAQTALTLANGIIASKAQVMFGPTLSAGCNAIAPIVRNGPLDYCFRPAWSRSMDRTSSCTRFRAPIRSASTSATIAGAVSGASRC